MKQHSRPTPKQTLRGMRHFLKGILGSHDWATRDQLLLNHRTLVRVRQMLKALRYRAPTAEDVFELHWLVDFTDSRTGKRLCCWGHRHKNKAEVLHCVSDAFPMLLNKHHGASMGCCSTDAP